MRSALLVLVVACGRSPIADLPEPPATGTEPDCSAVEAAHERELKALSARLELLETESAALEREKDELMRRLDAMDTETQRQKLLEEKQELERKLDARPR